MGSVGSLAAHTGEKTMTCWGTWKALGVLAVAASLGDPEEEATGEPKRVGAEKILGRDCDIMENGATRFWSWQGLPLKVVIRKPKGVSTTEATAVETPFKADPSLFQPPAE